MKRIRGFCMAVLIAALAGIICSCPESGARDDVEIDKNAARMQTFVKKISSYARELRPGFIIIPQNGAELAFNNTDPNEGEMISYIEAIDGMGIEELFYNGSRLDTDTERLALLGKLKNRVKIMVSDYITNDTGEQKLRNAVELNKNAGFISFPRAENNYHYKLIPHGGITDENLENIEKLKGAKNYLYLIAADTEPASGREEMKEAMIAAVAATNYDIVLLDLFLWGEDFAFTPEEIASLKTKHGGGTRLVISYINIGAAETFRYYWKDGWKRGSPSWIKKNYAGYDDEYWVEFWNPEWERIIFGGDDSYIKKIIDAGFDGAYLDNVEAYYFLVNEH